MNFPVNFFLTQCPKHQHIADGVVQRQQENHEKLNFKLKKKIVSTTTKEAAEKEI